VTELAPGSPTRVLHVPYTYFPDASGGTEIYVRQLALGLGERGISSAIAAPGAIAARYRLDGLDVYRFATDSRPRLELAYGVADEIAAEGFRQIGAEVRPAIVHLHARTAAVSERLVEIAHESGARVVFTYHTPTVSCARGTMMLFGEQPCDGVIERRRCTACALVAHGAPRWLAGPSARIPDGLGTLALRLPGGSKAATALAVVDLLRGSLRQFERLMGKVDHVVAVCQWVYDVLKRNGVPEAKITLCRQGVSSGGDVCERRSFPASAEPLKIAYFGRIDRTKGADLLASALAAIPHANVRLDIYAINQSEKNVEMERIVALAALDPRVSIHPARPPEEVREVMAEHDLVAIPSRLLETGPLVALEAFSAGTPVIGANLGGIAELVTHNVDGILVKSDSPRDWAATIERLSRNRDTVARLRSNIKPPRTMRDCASDMAGLYQRLLAN
jgi:glycosyltransferase involved in cell wall biosynthesis